MTKIPSWKDRMIDKQYIFSKGSVEDVKEGMNVNMLLSIVLCFGIGKSYVLVYL